MQTCDLFVIGGGSGGVRAGRLAAEAGARVVLAENQNLGGTCVNLGCVPKKLFVYAADFSEAAADAAAFGWTAAQAGPMEWPVLRENKNREIARLNRAYQNNLEKAGVEVLSATARISGPHSVVANEREYRAEKILVAVGAKPVRLAIPGAEVGVVSDDMFHLESLPRRAVVVGGGYIALEFAGILAGLGVETTLCFRADLPLRGFDDDLRRVAAAEVAKRGVRFQAGSAPVRAEDSGGEKILSLASGEKLAADLILFATGRRPALDEVGLENAGVSPDEKGFLRADESFCVGGGGGGSVYAVGDILPTPALTPVAIAEAAVFAARAFGGDAAARMDYANIPTAVFCRPNLASVGLTEARARERFGEVEVFRAEFAAMKDSLPENGKRTLVKMIAAKGGGRVLGAHIAGANAGEIIQGVAVAVKTGATKRDFDSVVGVHPTTAEELVTLR